MTRPTLEVLADMRADTLRAFLELRREAEEAGDRRQVEVCDRAIDGDAVASDACWEAIEYAAARAAE